MEFRDLKQQYQVLKAEIDALTRCVMRIENKTREEAVGKIMEYINAHIVYNDTNDRYYFISDELFGVYRFAHKIAEGKEAEYEKE